jgi:hypothetical protein
MNRPNAQLMKQYGTEDVFFAKTAGEVPLLARLVAGLTNAELAHSNQKGDQKAQQARALELQALQEYEQARLQQAEEALRYTPVPDQAMMRLASIAVDAGADLAKMGGIGTGALPAAGNLLAQGKKWLGGGLGMKANLALAGGTLATGILASKAMHAGTAALSKEPTTPSYGMGHPVRGVGYQLPFGVNSYGQPQVGTPLG